MQLRESTVARLGLVALALVEWRHAALLVWGGLMPAHPAAIALVLALYLTSFGLILQALADRPLERLPRWILGPMLLVPIAFVYRDAVFKAGADMYPTTDGHVFMDVAARVLLQGKNPYAYPLSESFRIYQMPLRSATPMLDGDFSDRLAYPALSFLALVPFVLAGLPTYLVYGSCFVATIALVVRRAPWWASCLVFAFFTWDETFLSMTFGGVTDSVWCLCLLAAVLLWERPRLAAIFVGLACAQKQHPWFFVPFLLLRLAAEHGEKPWRGVARDFVVRVALVFAVLNVPFLLWGPKTWILGLAEPLVAPMIQLSEGLTALSMTGYVVIPRAASSLTFWGLYAFALWIYARHIAVLRAWCWMLPAIVLWFGYRALMSYWYFNVPLVVGALLVPATPVPPWLAPASAAVVRRDVRLAFALAGALVVALVGFALRPAPFEVTVLGPMDSWDSHVFRLRVRVTNRLSKESLPKFSVQTTGLQPLRWVVDAGGVLAPGATGEFIIRGARPANTFEINAGARLAVNDGGDGRATFVTIPPDLAVYRLDHVPNAGFRVLDTRTGNPYGWTFDRSDADIEHVPLPALDGDARIAFVFAEPTQKAASTACFPGQKLEAARLEGARFADLLTTMELPLDAVSLRVNVPATANRAPWEELYGLHLAVDGWQGYVLFDASPSRGVLPNGSPYLGIAAPRGAWSSVNLELATVLGELGAPVEARRFLYNRVPDVDYPSLAVQLGLFASAPSGAKVRFEFGGFEQPLGSRHENELVRRSLGDPSRLATWRAERELENGNPSHAARLLADTANTPGASTRRLRLLGDAELGAGHFAEAEAAYQRVLAHGEDAAAEKGYGWALLRAGDPAGAAAHFDRARQLFGASNDAAPRIHYFDALTGLVLATAKLGDCAASRRWADAAAKEAPMIPVPSPSECSR